MLGALVILLVLSCCGSNPNSLISSYFGMVLSDIYCYHPSLIKILIDVELIAVFLVHFIKKVIMFPSCVHEFEKKQINLFLYWFV